MNRWMVKTIFFLFLLISSFVHADSPKKSTIQTIAGQIEQLKTGLTKDQQRQTDLQQQLKESELTLAALSQEIFHLNQEQTKEQKELLRLKNEEDLTQIKFHKQHNALAEQLRAAYRLGKVSEVKILLNQENPNTLNRYLGYYRYLAEQRLVLITTIKETLASLTQTMQAIEEHQNSLKKLLEQKKAQQTKQQATQKIRQQLIATLNQDVQTKQQQLDNLLENQKTLQEAIRQLGTQSFSLPQNISFAELQGKLHWPTTGTILANFGSNMDVGDQHMTGVVIKAPLGTPIHAISHGKIIFANWLRGFGLLVIINHGNGYMSLYARTQSLYVKVGDQVKAGDIIATTGNTGGYEIPSLYFEIRQNGLPVNPSLWCRYT
jgi:septal ring factor EnvC (AmiA/AmiB activator)